MSATPVPDLRGVVEKALRESRIKGMVVGVARAGRPPEYLAVGTDREGRPLAADSLFPVASVTKLATALAVLRLVDRGIFDLDDPLAYHVPEAVPSAHMGVTIRRLLSHTAGLPLDLPRGSAPYRPGLDWGALAAACVQTPLEREPATRVQYSNVGYGLLAIAVERATARDYPEALSDLVLGPLGIEGYMGPSPRPAVVLGGIRSSHAKTPLEPFNSHFWQSLALPWAGLLTTVEGAIALVRAFADVSNGLLQPGTAAEATRNQVGDLGGGFVRPLLWPRCPWGLGPEMRDDKSPHWAPREASPRSFGHSGASGAVAWVDPEAGAAWAILGTRTADSGWLVRQAPAIGAAVLAETSP